MNTIRFPHLYLTLPSVPQYFGLGSFSIACYGIVIAAAVVSGLWIVMRTARQTGQEEDAFFNYGLLTVVFSILCARIYYVVFSWDYYRVHLAEIINLRGGGLAIYGGVLGGILFTFLYARKIRKPVLQLLDTAMPGLVWGQMLGRWGNFFNREAFGGYTDSLFAMQIPLGRANPAHVTEEMTAHLQEIGGIAFIQVHPTFLYESFWNLGVFLILLLVIRKTRTIAVSDCTVPDHSGFRRETNGARRKKQDTAVMESSASGRYPYGIVFCMYLILYGTGRFWIEGLRTDQLLIPKIGIPVSQMLSVVLFLCGLAGIIVIRYRFYKSAGRKHVISERDG